MNEVLIFHQTSPGTYNININMYGMYKIECWGAKGSSRGYNNGGNGGYCSGTIELIPQILQCNVGGMNGFNGGGYSPWGGYAGGASDVRINSYSLYDRIIVAGGGGSCGAPNKPGGVGGGLVGESRYESYGSGGSGGVQNGAGVYGAFGVGGNGVYYANGYGGAGGGGWYGGGGVYPDSSGDDDRGGGGGSGYVLTESSFKPNGYNPTIFKKFTESTLIDGNNSMPNFNGPGTMAGNNINGCVRITLIKPINYILTFSILTEDGKYYIPSKDWYDYETNEFIPLTLDEIKDYKNNFYKFIYNVEELNKRIYINESISFLPFDKLNMNNARIFKLEVFDYDFNMINVIDLSHSRFDKYVISPSKVIFKNNLTIDNIINSTIKITGYSQHSEYNNFFDIGDLSNTKVLIKYQNKFYGNDFKETTHENILLDGFEGNEFNNYKIKFIGNFDIYIAFKNRVINDTERLKYIKYHTRNFELTNRVNPSHIDIYRDKNSDSIYVKLINDYNNLLIKKLENTEIQFGESIETF